MCLTRRPAPLDQYLLHVRPQLQPPAVLLQAPHQGIHHGLAATPRELQVAVGAVPAAGQGRGILKFSAWGTQEGM